MIIIPTYNERKNIRSLVFRIRQILPQIPILFVDDNSPDQTAEEIKEIQKNDSNIYLLSRPAKGGFASAYLDGLRLALSKYNPQFIVTMDADLSHPPEKLPEIIEIINSGKVGIGSRYVNGGGVRNWKLKRRILSKIGNFYARNLVKLPIRDITAGFIGIPKEIISKLNLDSIKSHGYSFLMELKVSLINNGAQVVEVPIIFEERKEGESKIGRSIVTEGLNYPLRQFWQRQKNLNAHAWALFFITFIIYLWNLPRTIFFGDSPEFMASAATLGIPHPPGYPAYVLLAKLFTYLPFGRIEFRIGLFSALCASISLVLFYFILRKIIKNPHVALAAALTLGFTNIFWSQAIMAKVYMPFLLIVLWTLLLFLKFFENQKPLYLIWAAFLFGFGFGMHQIMFLLLPVFAYVIATYVYSIPNLKTYRFNTKSFLGGILAFALGMSVYGFLIIRSHTNGDFYSFPTLFDASRPGNWNGFVHYLFRTDYEDYGGSFILKDKLVYLGSALEWIWKQFYWLLILAPFGFIELSKNKKILITTTSIFLLNLVGIIFLRSTGFSLENDVIFSYYYLPAYTMIAIWIGLGLSYVWRQNLFKYSPALLVIPAILFAVNLKNNNLHDFGFVDNYTSTVLQSLPPNAVLLENFTGSNTDTLSFGFDFQQKVKHLRPDVTLLSAYRMYPNVDRRILGWVYQLNDPVQSRLHLTRYAFKFFPGRPIYSTYVVDDLDAKEPWTGVSNGLVYHLYSDNKNIQPEQNYYQLNFDKDAYILQSDIYGQDLLAQYFYTQAGYWMAQKNLASAQENFVKAIKYDNRPTGVDQHSYMYYRDRILGKL